MRVRSWVFLPSLVISFEVYALITATAQSSCFSLTFTEILAPAHLWHSLQETPMSCSVLLVLPLTWGILCLRGWLAHSQTFLTSSSRLSLQCTRVTCCHSHTPDFYTTTAAADSVNTPQSRPSSFPALMSTRNSNWSSVSGLLTSFPNHISHSMLSSSQARWCFTVLKLSKPPHWF